ncbi:MAG: hypothetical protein JWM68_147 [Verrucomicrobiales bacterium]|nr:hypothetical protein [Verrucomicrobiales bacterium]
METTSEKISNKQLVEQKPALGKRVMVTTANFRCLGFLDGHDIWRQSFSGEPLKDVLGWEAIESVQKN